MLRILGWLLGLAGLLAIAFWGVVALVVETPPTAVHYVGGGGAMLVALWVLLDWDQLRNLGQDQTVGRSAVASLAVVMAAAIAITANMVAWRNDKRWDLTQDQRYTLSQQSIDLASKLDREVEVLAFFPGGAPEARNFEELMKGYQEHTSLLKVTFVDPYADPVQAEQNKILSATGTVILRVGENTQRIESGFDEEAITNALVRVTSDRSHPICVVTGHGEFDLEDDYSPNGIGIARIRLEGQNYSVSGLTLLETQPTPDTCAVVVLAGPRSDLLAAERDRLARYVAAGGQLIAMLDPMVADETAADFARYGFRLGRDVVIEGDPNRQVAGGDPTYVVLDESSYDVSPITSKLRGVVILPLARSVGRGEELAGVNVQVLARGTAQSWGETSLAADTPAAPDAGADLVGEVPLVASAEVTDPAAIRLDTAPAPASAAPIALAAAAPAPELPTRAGGRVVVFGDADFASNLYLLKGTNQDLLFNTIAWMVGEEDQISIRANEVQAGQLEVDLGSLLVAGGLSLVVVPGLAVAGALGTWLYRRRL